MAELETLCQSDYLSLGEIIPIPEDITGTPDTIVDAAASGPCAPSTIPPKIIILNVIRKDETALES